MGETPQYFSEKMICINFFKRCKMKFPLIICLLLSAINNLFTQSVVGEYTDIDSSGSIELREDNSFFYGDLPLGSCHLGAYYYVGNYKTEKNIVTLTTIPEQTYRFNAKPFLQNDTNKLVIKVGNKLISMFKNVTIGINYENMIYFKPDSNGIIEIIWNDTIWKNEQDRSILFIRLKTESCYADFSFFLGNNNGYVIDYNLEKKINNTSFIENTFKFKRGNNKLKLVKTTVKHPVIQQLIKTQ